MKHYFLFQLKIVILLCIAINCRKIHVRVDDYESNMGGKNAVISIQRFPVALENDTITGIQKEGTTTAVIFKDEANKLVTNYSNVNNFIMYHIEEGEHKKDFKYLSIARQFHFFNRVLFFQKILATPFTLGYVWLFPHDEYSDKLLVYNKDHADVPGYVTLDFFDSRYSRDYSIMITIINQGDMPITDEFSVVDVLPNFLEFESVEFNSDGGISEVAYDLHQNENSQVIPFKIRPTSRGLKSGEYIQLKIHFKPNLQKFKVDKYNLNLTTLSSPAKDQNVLVEDNTDSSKDAKSINEEPKPDLQKKSKENKVSLKKTKLDKSKKK